MRSDTVCPTVTPMPFWLDGWNPASSAVRS